MLKPRQHGGYEMDPQVFYDIQMALAEGCMSTAWVYGVIGVHNWQIALFDPRAARKIGVDASNLAVTVARINEYAKSGVDLEFGKGDSAIDRYYSDRNVKPNPCLGPIVKPPFYAVRMDAGEIGTKGGLVTDERARVLRALHTLRQG